MLGLLTSREGLQISREGRPHQVAWHLKSQALRRCRASCQRHAATGFLMCHKRGTGKKKHENWSKNLVCTGDRGPKQMHRGRRRRGLIVFWRYRESAPASCFIGPPVEFPYAEGNLFIFFPPPWQVGSSPLVWGPKRSSLASASPRLPTGWCSGIVSFQWQIPPSRVPRTWAARRGVANGANLQLFSSLFAFPVTEAALRSAGNTQRVSIWQMLHQSALMCQHR